MHVKHVKKITLGEVRLLKRCKATCASVGAVCQKKTTTTRFFSESESSVCAVRWDRLHFQLNVLTLPVTHLCIENHLAQNPPRHHKSITLQWGNNQPYWFSLLLSLTWKNDPVRSETHQFSIFDRPLYYGMRVWSANKFRWGDFLGLDAVHPGWFLMLPLLIGVSSLQVANCIVCLLSFQPFCVSAFTFLIIHPPSLS